MLEPLVSLMSRLGPCRARISWDRHTQTHKPSTATLAAHAHRGLITPNIKSTTFQGNSTCSHFLRSASTSHTVHENLDVHCITWIATPGTHSPTYHANVKTVVIGQSVNCSWCRNSSPHNCLTSFSVTLVRCTVWLRTESQQTELLPIKVWYS